jgi:hypothetical protein
MNPLVPLGGTRGSLFTWQRQLQSTQGPGTAARSPAPPEHSPKTGGAHAVLDGRRPCRDLRRQRVLPRHPPGQPRSFRPMGSNCREDALVAPVKMCVCLNSLTHERMRAQPFESWACACLRPCRWSGAGNPRTARPHDPGRGPCPSALRAWSRCQPLVAQNSSKIVPSPPDWRACNAPRSVTTSRWLTSVPLTEA